MTEQPFAVFAPFSDRIDVRFFDKADALSRDEDLAFALESSRFVSLKQVHGNGVVISKEPSKRVVEADASATNMSDLWLTIRAADCQQFIVYEPTKNILGVIHAGWRGLKANIIPAFFDALKNEWGIDPSKTIVAAGPSLCTQCAEFTDPVTELAGLDPRFFHSRTADLRGIADAQFNDLGVTHIARDPRCTRCECSTLWSYRGGDREAVKAGSTNVIVARLR